MNLKFISDSRSKGLVAIQGGIALCGVRVPDLHVLHRASAPSSGYLKAPR